METILNNPRIRDRDLADLARPLMSIVKEYFEDEKHKEEFEKWLKEERERRERECTW